MAFAGQPRFIDTATELQYHCDIYNGTGLGRLS
jgi:hypothetical protein